MEELLLWSDNLYDLFWRRKLAGWSFLDEWCYEEAKYYRQIKSILIESTSQKTDIEAAKRYLDAKMKKILCFGENPLELLWQMQNSQ